MWLRKIEAYKDIYYIQTKIFLNLTITNPLKEKVIKIHSWCSQSSNIGKISLIITTATLLTAAITLIVAIIVPYNQAKSETNIKRNLLFGENYYNFGLLNSYLEIVNDAEDKTTQEDAALTNEIKTILLNNKFSLDVYKNNWDTILKLECAETQAKAIAHMDAINSTGDALAQIYILDALAFNDNQLENSRSRTKFFIDQLKKLTNELNGFFIEMQECKFKN